jgi:hypothetical protein
MLACDSPEGLSYSHRSSLVLVLATDRNVACGTVLDGMCTITAQTTAPMRNALLAWRSDSSCLQALLVSTNCAVLLC